MSSQDRTLRLAIGVPVLGTLAVYAPLLAAGFAWDDEVLVAGLAQASPSLGALFTQQLWTGQEALGSFYRPWVMLDFVGTMRLFGPSPAAFHALSIGLHLAVGALLGVLVARRSSPWVGLGVAGVFALHPAQQEAVAFIAARNDLWATGAVLGAALLWRSRAWWLAGPAILLGLLSKESAIVALPLLVWVEDERRWARHLVGLAAVGAYAALRLGSGVETSELALPSAMQAAAGLAQGGLLLVGVERPCAGQSLDWLAGRPPLVFLGTLVLGGLAAFGRREGLGAWALGLLALAVTLPVSATTDLAADRYLYLPLALWGLGATEGLQRLPMDRRTLAVGALLLAGCAGLNALSIGRWRSTEALFQHGVRCDPTPRSRHLLGVKYARMGAPDAARQALSENVGLGYVPSMVELGAVELSTGHFDRALVLFDQADAGGFGDRGRLRANQAAALRLSGNLVGAWQVVAVGMQEAPQHPGLAVQGLALCALMDRDPAPFWAALEGQDRAAVEAHVARLVEETGR